jgi:hypothetical protein
MSKFDDALKEQYFKNVAAVIRRNRALINETTEALVGFIPQLARPIDADVVAEIQREIEIRNNELVQNNGILAKETDAQNDNSNSPCPSRDDAGTVADR